MAIVQLKAKVRVIVPFYIHWYLKGVAWMTVISGLEPDWAKVRQFLDRHIRTKVLGVVQRE